MKTIAFVIITLLLLNTGNIMAQNNQPVEKRTKIEITTPYGNIVAELYNETPQHRDNFIKLVKEGWYEGSPFHRVISNFMIQGGQNSDGRLDPGYKVPAEIVPQFFHKKGALAAARMPDQVNPEKASSGSQFYIVQGNVLSSSDVDMMEKRSGSKYPEEARTAYTTVGGSPHLDGHYTVFGQVISGFDVIDKIATVERDKMDKPVQDLRMSVKILEE